MAGLRKMELGEKIKVKNINNKIQDLNEETEKKLFSNKTNNKENR